MKKYSKFLPYPLLLLALILYLYQLNTSSRLQTQLLSANTSEEDLKGNLQLLQLKTDGDEFFFAGEIDKATNLYKQYESQTRENIIENRLNWYNAFDSTSRELLLSAEQMRDELTMVRSELNARGKLLLENENIIESKSQQLLVYEKRIKSIKDSLISLCNQEKESLSKAKTIDTLSFLSSKSHKIRYLGDLKSGKANGRGSGMWSTGGYYYGAWSNNMRHGKGVYHWKDGEHYIGEYKNDIREGVGSYYWNNGERYEGSWKADQRNGFGTLYDPTGKVKYKGNWVNDHPMN